MKNAPLLTKRDFSRVRQAVDSPAVQKALPEGIDEDRAQRDLLGAIASQRAKRRVVRIVARAIARSSVGKKKKTLRIRLAR